MIWMRRMSGPSGADEMDFLAAEESLEIQVEGHSIAIVMQTSGEDQELTTGFLVTEGLQRSVDDLVDIKHQSHCLVPARYGSDRRIDFDETGPGEEPSPQTTSIRPATRSPMMNPRRAVESSTQLRMLAGHERASETAGFIRFRSSSTVSDHRV
jgi:hypothetical protein